MLSIENAAYYVPNNFQSIEDASSWFGITPLQAKIYKRVFGLNTFPVADKLFAEDLVKKTLYNLLSDGSVNFDSIKLIIHAHTGQVLCPFGESVINNIRNEFYMNDALYIGTSLNNCTSIFDAFEIAEILLCDYEKDAKALVIVGEVTFTQALRLVPNVSVTGDAAAAVIVKKHSNHNQLLAMTVSCHGEFSKGLWLDHEDQLKFESSFQMMMKNVIDETLNKVGVTLQELSLILPHNVNMRFWRQFSRDFNISPNKIFTGNILKYAHCFGADAIINFVDAKNNGHLKKGDYFLMFTAGLGSTLGAALFQY